MSLIIGEGLASYLAAQSLTAVSDEVFHINSDGSTWSTVVTRERGMIYATDYSGEWEIIDPFERLAT